MPKKKTDQKYFENLFQQYLEEKDVEFVREAILVPGRKFRVDFYVPRNRAVFEIQGGTFTKGGHSTGTGISRDCEKSNLLQINGYMVFKIPTNWFSDAEKYYHIMEILDFLKAN